MMAILRGLTSGYRSYARRAAATAPEPSEEDE
jgi:hypothetical protein